MFVTIWDLDWYYAKDKTNVYNTDAMLLSSYHKQLGDKVNFVRTAYDIKRPYNIYYIIKEKTETPNPPIEFLVDRSIRWLGACSLGKKQYKMPSEVYACRPDYLLYPQKNTREERSDYLHLFDDNGKLLQKTQDVENSFKNKYVIVVDKDFWSASEQDLLKALEILQSYNRISFQYPIRLQRLFQKAALQAAFLKLNFTSGSKLTWEEIPLNWGEEAIKFCTQCKQTWSNTKVGPLSITYAVPFKELSKQWALFLSLCDLILKGKQSKILVKILYPDNYQINIQQLAAPYMFQELAAFCERCAEKPQLSWLEYLCYKYGRAISRDECFVYLNNPQNWHPEFRDLVRQTYQQKDFFLLRWGEEYFDQGYIAWSELEREFCYGL
jgi:hypothetical protein